MFILPTSSSSVEPWLLFPVSFVSVQSRPWWLGDSRWLTGRDRSRLFYLGSSLTEIKDGLRNNSNYHKRYKVRTLIPKGVLLSKLEMVLGWYIHGGNWVKCLIRWFRLSGYSVSIPPRTWPSSESERRRSRVRLQSILFTHGDSPSTRPRVGSRGLLDVE